MNIAIAIDSPAAAEALRRALAEAPDLVLRWVADNGPAALDLCRSQPPDLLLMGLGLPPADGVEATRRIMAERPCPILLVSASLAEDYGKIYQALDSGALDAANLPGLDASGNLVGGADLLRRIDTLRTLAGQTPRSRNRAAIRLAEAEAPEYPPPLVAIGASTGGPKALATLLERLPADFPAAVVIVQHLDPPLMEGLAGWLDRVSPLRVTAFSGAARLRAGQVWLAAAAEHLILDDSLGLSFTPEPRELACRPSVDVFFQSVARHPEIRGCGVLLTGMGRDGAAGLLALRKAGFHTIAQDEASSVVFGMPKAAAELDGASDVLPLAAIAGRLVERARLLAAPVSS